MYVARRMRISSSTPPASPAATMLRNRSSNTRLCLPSESASVEPASTSRVVSWITRPNEGRLVCLARMSRHCTSGRPAEIMVANCRVKIARSFVDTPPPNFGICTPDDFGRREVTRMRFLRRISSASSCRPTSISPVCASPASVRPFQMNSAIVPPRPSGRRPQDLLEHALELHAVRAAVHGVFGSQLLVEHRLHERLVHRLHAVLLTGLHEAVDLVPLRFAHDALMQAGQKYGMQTMN